MAILYPPIEVIQKRKPKATSGEKALLAFLLNAYDDKYEIFFQPFLNGDLPDIIVMRKGGGVMIFEVKDWDLLNYNVTEKGIWKVNKNESILGCVYSGPISTTNSGANGTSIPDETEPLILN